LIESVPTVNAVVVQAAVCDEVSVTAAHPVMVAPFEVKATVPVGAGGPAGVTVAVNVTEAPAVEGFKLEISAVAEASLFEFTVWVTTFDVLALL
jgi:hypothetical protein